MSPLAGLPAPASMRVNVPRLVTAYYTQHPESSLPQQRVRFGASGHRGSAFDKTFNESHIVAITQAVCDYRAQDRGPLFLGIDTHALSVPAFATALEVLAANEVVAMIASEDEYTPTPAISHAILTYNRGRTSGFADGIVITPSHNPPADGGFKYNPPHGGPARWFRIGRVSFAWTQGALSWCRWIDARHAARAEAVTTDEDQYRVPAGTIW